MTIDIEKLEEVAKQCLSESCGESDWYNKEAISSLTEGYLKNDIDGAYIEAATPAKVLALVAEVRALREANQKLHRRAQRIEAPREQFSALLRHANNHWGDTWVHEFNRLIEAHTEIQAMFRELARVYPYPQAGQCMHSCTDRNAEFPREKHPGIWANCFLTSHGGMKSIRVLDEVRRAIDEMVSLRNLEDAIRHDREMFEGTSDEDNPMGILVKNALEAIDTLRGAR